MPTPKPFLSYSQQLDKLTNEKNLIINDAGYAEKTLRQISYFALVSGYKELLLNPTTRKFKDDTTFEELVALYKFDANLRELFLKYLLVFEQKMRSLLSYYFTEKHGENQQQYLAQNNYNNIPVYAADITRLTQKFAAAIQSNDYPYITYQRRKYANVPLWVLVNVLTFGNISHMYQVMQSDIQSGISLNFYNVKERELMQYLRVLTKFRNVCAHNERLFSFRTKDAIPDTGLHASLRIPKKGSQYILGKRDLFCVVIALRYLIDKEDFKQFKGRLTRIIDQFLSSTTHITENELLAKMGFPANWKKITAYRI